MLIYSGRGAFAEKPLCRCGYRSGIKAAELAQLGHCALSHKLIVNPETTHRDGIEPFILK